MNERNKNVYLQRWHGNISEHWSIHQWMILDHSQTEQSQTVTECHQSPVNKQSKTLACFDRSSFVARELREEFLAGLSYVRRLHR